MADKKVAFAAGEFDFRLLGRSDLDQFSIGAQKLENMTVNFGGGARKRDGLRFVALLAPTGPVTGTISGGYNGANYNNAVFDG